LTGDRHGGSAVDYTVNCQVGFPYMTGNSDEPVNHVLAAWDVITGQTLALGLLAAERHRRITGKGQMIKLALADVALATLGNLGFIAEAQINGQDREAYGNYLFGAYGKDFVTADGRRVMVVGLTGNQWKGIIRSTGLGEAFDRLSEELDLDLSKEGCRFEAREGISHLLAPWFTSHSYAEIEALFDGNGVCWGKYQSVVELVDNDIECSTENPLFQNVEQAGIGSYLMPSSPLQFGEFARQPVRPAPRVGQHTDEILAHELGLSSTEIGKLHDAGVVSGVG
ncbi:MAG: CoA transferase, partial [Porticoccaceae bacterium]|nr:CoA transferase [Porticoccaceae bacterium]